MLQLAGGPELRYHDAKDMGKIYSTRGLDLAPGYEGQGPDEDDPALYLEVFRETLRPRRGEMKGMLTDQSFVAGFGNACADEVCRRAELHPFRRQPSPSDEEVARLYEAMRSVLAEAADTLEARVGDEIHVEARDSLAAHGKAGEACRRCGVLSAR